MSSDSSSAAPATELAPLTVHINGKGDGAAAASASHSAGNSYFKYIEKLRSAWTDQPDLTVEYTNFGYKVPLPVKERGIPTLAKAFGSVANLFQKRATYDFHAIAPTTGVIRPGTMTLILAPPGAGKSLFLKGISGRLSRDSHLQGDLRFNGLTQSEADRLGLNVRKMAAYVDQQDFHMSLLTVRETLQFSLDNAVADVAMLNDPELVELHKTKVDALLDILHLKECQNTILGNALLRGVSGGQKKRVSIGEFMITNARLLAMDEITNGLDASASFNIMKALRHWTRVSSGSVVTALLQPTPECFEVFDDLILMREGTIVYHGPRASVGQYFESIGVVPPHDVDMADFITDFLSDPKSVYSRTLLKFVRQAELHASPNGKLARQHSNLLKLAQASSRRLLALSPGLEGELAQSLKNLNSMQLQDETEKKSPETDKEKEKSASASSNEIAVRFHGLADESTNGNNVVIERFTIAPSNGSVSDQPMRVTESAAAAVEAVPTDKLPLTTSALVAAFQSSSYYKRQEGYLAEANKLRGEAASHLNDREGFLSTLSPYTRKQFYSSFSRDSSAHVSMIFQRQWLLTKRNASFIGPRIGQSIFMGCVLGSLYYQLGIEDALNRVGLLLFAAIFSSFSNMSELPFANEFKGAVHKQSDASMFPVWSYVVASVLCHLPLAAVETSLFSVLLYFMTGFTSEAGRFFFFLLMLFSMNFCMANLYRMVCYLMPNEDLAQQLAGPVTAISLLFGGFLITEDKIPNFLIEFFWISPLSWIVRSLAINEFNADRYGPTQGKENLRTFQMRSDFGWTWGGFGYLIGLAFFLMACSTLALMYFRNTLITGTKRLAAEDEEDETEKDPKAMLNAMAQGTKKSSSLRQNGSGRSAASVLPFIPIDLAWNDLHYTVQVPSEDKKSTVDRKLLNGISGYAKAGTLTALMGSSGAGKTTLMDVIVGRKTAGKIEGQILINGYPQELRSFARISGYVEQTDIHMALQTVREALLFSAKLRLPASVSDKQRHDFVEEILDILELKEIADRIIGDELVEGLSPGQRKRVTIGVELTSNPSVLFLDEPTSGLDSRAAMVVMRVIKRIATTGRTIVATIHQPNSDIFFSFDRLLLLRSGGFEVYFGDVGEFGSSLVEYFQCVPLQPALKPLLPEATNPASWMLDVIGNNPTAYADPAAAAKAIKESGTVDFAPLYAESSLRRENLAELERVSKALADSEPLKFTSTYAQSYWVQFVEVFKRLCSTYWRDVDYNVSRMIIITFLGILFGLVFLQINTDDQPGLISMNSALFMTLGFVGVINCVTAMSSLYRSRAVFYREQAANMYVPHVYSTGIFIVELPFWFVTSMLFVVSFHFMMGLSSSAHMFWLHVFFNFLITVFCASVGQLLIAVLPNLMVANIIQGLCFTWIFLFGGTFIVKDSIPVGYLWSYYLSPLGKGVISIMTEQFACRPTGSGIPGVDNSCPSIMAALKGPKQLWYKHEFLSAYLDSGFDVWQNYVGWLFLEIVVVRLLCAMAIAKVRHIVR